MNWFIIKNKKQSLLVLEFQGGLKVNVKPGGCYYWAGPEDSQVSLQQYIDTEEIEAWLVSVKEERETIPWLQEGF